MILAAARHQFRSPGYNSAKVADIASMAGVSRATVYNHFEDKGEILWALVSEFVRGYERVATTVSVESSAKESAFDALLHIVEGMLLWRLDNADLRPSVEIARQLFPREFIQANRDADAALVKQIAEIHRRSAALGILRSEIDVEFASRALYGMVEWAVSSTDVVDARREEVLATARKLTVLQWYAMYTISPDDSPSLDAQRSA